MTGRDAVRDALADAHRREWAFVLASTVRVVRDLDLAEECVQDVFTDALERWTRDGVPATPGAWLTTAAHRRAVDVVRREVALRARLPLLVDPDPADGGPEEEGPAPDAPEAPIRDERLRLMLLCCHPALAQEARTALTLRLVCGLPTADIARVFLVPEATMAARITRAKRRIVGSGIPFRVPPPAALPARLQHVLDVVLLLLAAGHTAPSGEALLRVDLVDEALRLARMLRVLLPADPEVAGLLALVLATEGRRAARTDAGGRPVRLADQDRSAWDRAAIAEARALTMAALPDPGAGRYALQAAIAVLHAEAPASEATDWRQILGLYDRLLAVWPSPVVALNRAVPLAEVAGPAAALAEVDRLGAEGSLAGYRYLPAVRGDLLARLGREQEASAAFAEAAALPGNGAETAAILERLHDLAR